MEESNKKPKLRRLTDKNIEETIRIMESLGTELEKIIKRIEILKSKIKK